jgi:hypothetical protein
MIAPVLARNREKIFLASKSDARDYEGFKRDLERSLQAAGPGALRAGVAASGTCSGNWRDRDENDPVWPASPATGNRTASLCTEPGWGSHDDCGPG